ncbi:hypothetical protein J0X25_16115 [Haloterrigena alkaliphila]|nr:hypothetical protein [Haloterrigena alkaliphila]QSW98890.2 hypothetical protein J0X25_16115 [Haloterrigena alkaliphila]
MVENGERRRAAARCARCGRIGIVYVWPDGTRKPLGQTAFCDCDEQTLRLLEEEREAGGDGP